MNEPAVLCVLRSTIFMDLLGESPIGAWATWDRPGFEVAATSRKQGQEPWQKEGRCWAR
jgi:hypothetical protein